MSNDRGGIPWGVIAMLLVVCFPAGVVLLILKFMLPVLEQLFDGQKPKQEKISVQEFKELQDRIDPVSNSAKYKAEIKTAAKPNVIVHNGKINENIRSGEYSFTRDQLNGSVKENKTEQANDTPKSNPRSYINDQLDSAQAYTTKNAPHPVKTAANTVQENANNKPEVITPAQLKKKIPSGGSTALQVLGIIFGSIGFLLAGIFGLICLLAEQYSAGLLTAALVLAIVPGLPGLVMLYFGLRGRNQASRFRRYYELIGNKKEISIDRLAEVMDVSYTTALIDLQKMIDKGILQNAYIDKTERTYNVGNPFDAIKEKEARELARIEQEKIPDAAKRIREINDDIEDEEVSRKLDKLELITRRIFEYVEKKPELMPKLRNFTGYYLPTTLKILEAYARFEEQEVQGKNMSEAMKDIEELLDTLIKSFESQLDQLYDNETLDVSTDITVLENMLEREGLTGSGFNVMLDKDRTIEKM
ncbi:MAG: hypothetical protein E7334_08870 [Clostridiales bacterium]|nr:hypothetical protein [Clostridiales bacterium]